MTELRFIADLIRASGKRPMIEEFHYLSIDQRQALAFDLKALWDYGVFLIIVGVWSQQNMILNLNPDLTAGDGTIDRLVAAGFATRFSSTADRL